MPAGRSSRTTHQKIVDLFDNDWKGNRSTIRTRVDDMRSYDPSFSWDGRSDNPGEFSRLQATEMPVQKTRPVTLSGSAVIPLETNTGLEVLNVVQKPEQLSYIPLTREQRDVGMTNDLSGKIPMAHGAREENKYILIEDKPSFKNMHMTAPTFKALEVPVFMSEAGQQCDQRLLMPAQRREILEFEKKKNAADLYMKTATAARDRTKKQISGQQFRRGVLMVDSNENEESEIYGERAKRAHADKDYKAQIHLERKGFLARRASSLATNGNILVPDSIATRVQTNAFYQSKGGFTHALSFEETHNRLFCRGAERAPSNARTQKMRNCDLGGKQFNLINHAIIEHWPSRHFDRQQDKRMMHPSQESLEGTRNIQGSLYGI